MAYTSNVPQANQTIAFTQPIIQDNFGFIKTAVEQEHNFHITDATATYHLQASMPNKGSDPVPGDLPAGTNGMYYVKGGLPKFLNSSQSTFIQTTDYPSGTIAGTQALNNAGYSNIINIANNLCGTYFIFDKTAGVTAVAAGQFVTANNQLYISGNTVTGQDPNLTLNASGTILQAKTDSSSYNGTYTWLINFYAP